MAEEQVATKSRRWGRWIGFSLLGLVALLIAGHAFWGWWEEKKLGEEIAELRRKGEPMLVEELANRPVADADNAVILLREAAESIDEKSPAWQEFDVLILGLPLTDKEMTAVRRVMEENKSALGKLRAARGRKGVDWQLDPLRPILGQIQGLTEQKPLANLAAEAILLEHQRGNDREAMELARDMFAQSDALEQMAAGLIPHLVGIGASALACDRIFEIVPDLRVGMKEGEVAPEDLRKLIDMLLEEKTLREGLRMAMRVERANEVKGAQSLRSLSPPMDEKQRKGMAVMEYLGRPWLLKDGRLMLRSTTYMMKEAQEAADYPDFRERTKEETKRMSALRQNTGHFLLIMLGGFFEKPVESTFRAITARRLAGLALAIRLYQIEHEGRLPAKLADLVPRYLPGVPRDALARDKKIGYVAEADRPRVYSAGNNGTDDGGSDAPLKKGFDSGRWSEEDVVVDLNRQKRKVFD